MRRPRRLALAAAAMGLALAATGCTYFSPVQTHEFYQTADGTNANLMESGALMAGVRNAIVVVGEDGSAQLRGSVANYTSEEITVELEGRAEDQVVFSGGVSVPAGGVVELGSGEGSHQIAIGQFDVQPGATMDLTVTANGETVEITLPVTDTSLEYFQDEEATSAS